MTRDEIIKELEYIASIPSCVNEYYSFESVCDEIIENTKNLIFSLPDFEKYDLDIIYSPNGCITVEIKYTEDKYEKLISIGIGIYYFNVFCASYNNIDFDKLYNTRYYDDLYVFDFRSKFNEKIYNEILNISDLNFQPYLDKIDNIYGIKIDDVEIGCKFTKYKEAVEYKNIIKNRLNKKVKVFKKI